MKLNFHSLAFKQTVLILLGITVIFVAMISLLQRQVSSRMSELIMARGQEISEKHVSSIDNIFRRIRFRGNAETYFKTVPLSAGSGDHCAIAIVYLFDVKRKKVFPGKIFHIQEPFRHDRRSFPGNRPVPQSASAYRAAYAGSSFPIQYNSGTVKTQVPKTKIIRFYSKFNTI